MTLTLHHADDLQPLLEGLAASLASPLSDPLAADVVVVPTVGVRDAVTAHLGSRLGVSDIGGDGITANIDLLFIGRFLARALGRAGHGDDVDPDPWHISRLTWSVLDVLAADQSLRLPIEHKEVNWAFARRVADLFDRYAAQRPAMIQKWAENVPTDAALASSGTSAQLSDDHMWQFELWRAVRDHIGQPSLPELLPDLLGRLEAGELATDLPPRVALVGFVSIAPAQWQVVRALGHGRDVRVFLRTPSRRAWNDGEIDLRGELHARGGPEDGLDVARGRSNPLLISWGRRALDARAFLGGTPDVEIIDDDPPLAEATLAEPSSLLHAVQSDIRRDASPTLWKPDASADRSIQIHSCHGEVRQLEVLRDAIGHAFVDMPDLRPHEVLVLCPQLDRFAPLIDAVFDRGDMPIPVRVGDRSLMVDDATATAFHAVLDLVGSRASLTEILALLQLAPIRRRFGWTSTDVDTITAWALELGTRWGLSPEHREEWELPRDVTTGTWKMFVQRLLAGVAQAAPSPRAGVGGIPPFDGVGAQSASIAGGFAEFLARLVDLQAVIDEKRPIADWVVRLRATLDHFCAVDRDEPWAIDTLHASLTDLVDAATPLGELAVPSTNVLTFADVRAMVADAISARAGRMSLRSGAVTVTSMQPLHGVPARVICLLGLDDGSLAPGTFDGDDVLGVNPCIGERNPRHDARQMLLDTLLAARDRLIITCNGHDITTNAEVPLVVPLAELLDVVAATGTSATAHDVVVRHPRHGFNESVLRRDGLMPGLGRPFTFDGAMLEAAERRRQSSPSVQEIDVRRWLLPTAEIESDFEVGDLLSALKNPANQLLRQRLDVAELPRVRRLTDELALGIDKHTERELGGGLLSFVAERYPRPEDIKVNPFLDRRWTDSVDAWSDIVAFDGSMPPAALGGEAIAGVALKVLGIWHAAVKKNVPFVGHDRIPIDHQTVVPFLDGRSVPVRVTGDVTGVDLATAAIIDVGFVAFAPQRLLTAALKLALCQLSGLEPPTADATWKSKIICRNSTQGATGRILTLAGEPMASANALVALAVQLAWWSRRDAVPFFDGASFELGQSTFDIDGLPPKKLAAEMRYESCEPLWREWSADDLMADALVESDPVMLDPYSELPRVAAVAQWIWGVYRQCVVEEKNDVRAPSAPTQTETASA